ncbi:MAG: hypothetical protein KJ000_19630 [Pirellulaceae bacterium]|nr:hypothetical protein [Pirellulaceae bacterium]
MSYWYLQPLGNSYALVAAVALVLVLLLLVKPAFGRAGRRGHLLLAGLRGAVIALIVLAMLRPAHISTSRKPQTSALLVLFDSSRSMQLPDTGGRQSRWETQTATLQAAAPLLKELSEKIEVKVYAYDRELLPVEQAGQTLRLPDQPLGEQTDIGTNLHEALRRELGKRLAGVILMGDGVQTAFDPAVELLEAGRELGRLGYPLYAVPLGPVGNVVQARDVAVENLQDQYTVFVKNELPIRATVRVNGYVNKAIPVELEVVMPDGEIHRIGPVDVTTSEDNQQAPVELRYVPPVPGRYKLTLRAAEQPGELVTKNNQLSAYLRVLEGGLKVLYLEGQLRNEQVFLRRSLAASADIDLDFVWIDSRLRDRWPVDLSSKLSDPAYDVFLLGDLDATALGESNLKLLAEAVDDGKGLALLGGYHSFGAGGYRDTPLASVMPVVMDRFERQDFDAPIRQDLHLPGPIQMLPERDHPIVRLAQEAENLPLWKSLPPLSGANRWVGVKDAAGTMVVARSDAGDPLLAVGEYGRGRVVAMAGDSTWRWWMYGHETEHKRFWRQTILWLVRRDDLERSEVWIRMAQRRFFPGARVAFTAGATSPTGSAIPEAVLRAEWIFPDGQRRPLALRRDGDQWAGAIDAVEQPGDYAIEVTGELQGQTIGIAQGEFLVFDRDIELSNPAADHDQLARLAAMTQEVGGRLVAPEQLHALLEELRDQPPEMDIEIQTKWQLGDTPRDAWTLLLLLVALLTAEWALRKKWGLV